MACAGVFAGTGKADTAQNKLEAPAITKEVTQQIVGKDDFGRTITLDKQPGRIVSLSGSFIDVIYELGAGDALVGVVDTIAASYPETCRRYPSVLEKVRVGRFSSPNIEKIIALEPDLILPFASSDSPGKFTAVFERRGLRYAAFCSVETVDFGIAQIKRMGTLLGREKQAQVLSAKIATEVDGLTREIAGKIKHSPMVYYWWGARNGTYGNRAVVHELIEKAGGINLTRDFNTQYMELAPEYVIAADPDVILVSYWQESQIEPRLEALKKRPGFDQIKAVKNNRIYAIEGHAIHTPILFADVIRQFAGLFHPALFNSPDALQKKNLKGSGSDG